MFTFKIMKCTQNQHGWSIGCIRYKDGEIDSGFTLVSFPTEEEQIKYLNEAIEFFGFEATDFSI